MGSAPPERVSLPSRSEAPESQEDPTIAHFGALSVESYTAVCGPVPTALIISAIVVLAVVVPDVPVMVTVAAPVVAVADAVNVSTELAEPLAGGVTGLVPNAAVTPVGNPVMLSVVAALKLFWLATVMVLVPVAP